MAAQQVVALLDRVRVPTLVPVQRMVMKTDTYENATLNGFVLKGCWKELASEHPERQWHRSRGRELSKSGSFTGASKPQQWEFGDYPEEQYRQLMRKYKQLRRKT